MLRENRTQFILVILLAIVQIFDIIVHAATNQLEPLRVSSNIIILAWVTVLLTSTIKVKLMPLAVAAIAAYLLLNGIFLMLEGVTNPTQGGALRTMLFLLVFVTLLLSICLSFLLKARAQ